MVKPTIGVEPVSSGGLVAESNSQDLWMKDLD